MTLEQLRRMLRVQLPPMGSSARIERLEVSPDVWARLRSEVTATEEPAVFHWDVKVDRRLPPATVLPFDANGRLVEDDECAACGWPDHRPIEQSPCGCPCHSNRAALQSSDGDHK